MSVTAREISCALESACRITAARPVLSSKSGAMFGLRRNGFIAPLVLGRMLHAIDHEDFYRSLGRFQLHTELFLEGGEN